jgi:hypothetical protein
MTHTLRRIVAAVGVTALGVLAVASAGGPASAGPAAVPARALTADHSVVAAGAPVRVEPGAKEVQLGRPIGPRPANTPPDDNTKPYWVNVTQYAGEFPFPRNSCYTLFTPAAPHGMPLDQWYVNCAYGTFMTVCPGYKMYNTGDPYIYYDRYFQLGYYTGAPSWSDAAHWHYAATISTATYSTYYC